MHFTPLSPVEYELSHGGAGELRINTGIFQDLAGIFTGFPVMGNRMRLSHHRVKCRAFSTLAQLAGIILGKHPLLLHMAEETAVPVIAVGALFLPLQGKGIQLGTTERTWNTMLLQTLQALFRRFPLHRHGLRTVCGGLRRGFRSTAHCTLRQLLKAVHQTRSLRKFRAVQK